MIIYWKFNEYKRVTMYYGRVASLPSVIATPATGAVQKSVFKGMFRGMWRGMQ